MGESRWIEEFCPECHLHYTGKQDGIFYDYYKWQKAKWIFFGGLLILALILVLATVLFTGGGLSKSEIWLIVPILLAALFRVLSLWKGSMTRLERERKANADEFANDETPG